MKRVAVEVIILKEYPKGTARFFPGDKVWVTAKFADELEASGHARRCSSIRKPGLPKCPLKNIRYL